MRREDILRAMFDHQGLGLEIGPSYNPLVPKSEGFRVEILDYTDQPGLIAKYTNTPNVDIGKIEVVDYISDGRSMLSLIGEPERYDYIVASHVIEHTPDLLGFLKDCEALLKPEGILVLAVPDKRYCFDLFQPLSTTGTILQAALERRTRPLPGTVFDSIAYDVVKNGAIGWSIDDQGPAEFFSDLDQARQLFNQAKEAQDYIDVHVWRFVPSSFRLIVHDLNALHEIRLKEERFVPGQGHEFYISLSRSGTGYEGRRIDLANAAMHELAAVSLPPLNLTISS